MTKAFFDHISTTPLDSRVFEAMGPYFLDWYGNPSSHIHDQGQAAVRAVDQARAEVAAMIGAKGGRSSLPLEPPSRTTSPSSARRRARAPGSDMSSFRRSSISP